MLAKLNLATRKGVNGFPIRLTYFYKILSFNSKISLHKAKKKKRQFATYIVKAKYFNPVGNP